MVKSLLQSAHLIILTTCDYGLYDLRKPVNKVSDRSHRIITLPFLIVISDYDVGRVHLITLQ